MEKVPLNNVQLYHLATADAILKPCFYGTVACDRLPRRPIKSLQSIYSKSCGDYALFYLKDRAREVKA